MLDPLGTGYIGSHSGATKLLKLKSCVDFAEIAEVEIVRQFHLERSSRDRVSISLRSCVNFPGIHWSFEKSSPR